MKTTAELQAWLAGIQNPAGHSEIKHADLIELIEEILRLREENSGLLGIAKLYRDQNR